MIIESCTVEKRLTVSVCEVYNYPTVKRITHQKETESGESVVN